MGAEIKGVSFGIGRGDQLRRKSDLPEVRKADTGGGDGSASGMGEPPPKAAETDPRLILKRNAAYFRENAPPMDYPTDRKKGWPLGSGIVESAVKQFGKRVKGTEKFWSRAGAESTLALLSYFLSEDERWDRFWNHDLLKLRSAA